MRKLIVSNIMSLDGYFEGPGRDVMALPMDGFFDEQNLERLRAADTLLLGAATYTGLKGYWPAVAEDPAVSPAVAANPDVADLHRETGLRNNGSRRSSYPIHSQRRTRRRGPRPRPSCEGGTRTGRLPSSKTSQARTS